MINMKNIQNLIQVANKQKKAMLVIKNGKVIDVFSRRIIECDVAIENGKIVGLGCYEGEVEYDAKGCYLSPGFIDGHVHIESSMVLPQQFSKAVLPHGVTTVVTDPHEIANVLGVEGIEKMMEDSEHALLDIFFMLPSCVPATPFETAGATIRAKDLASLMKKENVLGLAEVMNYPAVLGGEEDMLEKIQLAIENNKVIDGHCAGLNQDAINVYRTATITTDHECVYPEEVIDRIQRGMYVLLREGSGAKNLRNLLKAVDEYNAARCLLCTDDKHIDELVEEGSIDHNIRICIEEGMNPLTAITMATINAAQCYGLKTKGAIAPGYDGDIVFLSDLETIKIERVLKDGKFIDEIEEELVPFTTIKNTMNIAPIEKDAIIIPMTTSNIANIIEVIPSSIVTKHVVEEVPVVDGEFIPSVEADLAYLAVIERHHGTGNIGLGIVKGLGLTSGAIASTVAHDSHHIVVASTTKEDLIAAINHLTKNGGGLTIVQNEKVIASIDLPFGGLMSTKSFNEVYEEAKQLNEGLTHISTVTDYNIFLTLSFLALPVIPAVKLTDKGLFHVGQFKHIPVEA
ncbi:MAG: adenine deaminase [Bacillaceae bacterium]